MVFAADIKGTRDRTISQGSSDSKESSKLSGASSAGERSFPGGSPTLKGSVGSAKSVIGLTINDFAVLGKLGEGGYGTVLLARHKATNMMSALKMMLKANVQTDGQADRVLAEARVLGEIKHPFIVSMFGVFQDELNIYFALEYIGGGDLFSRLADGGALDESTGRLVLAEVALALAHIHERGYMYRDLKPENVLVCTDGHIKLADFGLAKKMTDKMPAQSMRHSRMVGTPETLAPEVMGVAKALGPGGDYGASVDWWGLGIMACDVYTGLEMHVLLANAGSSKGRERLYAMYEEGTHVNQHVFNKIPPLAASLVRALLEVDVTKRLCCGGGGIDELRRHNFFANVNFDAVLARTIRAPLPKAGQGDLDVNGKPRFSVDKLEQNLVEFLNTPATALCEAAVAGDVDRLRELIAAGTEAGAIDHDGRTALHATATAGHVEIARLLVEDHGVDGSPVDRWGTTPLDDAMFGRHAELQSYLEKHGCKRGSGTADLCDAAAKGDLETLRTLIEQGHPVGQGDYDKRTALHLAASEGLLVVVQFLINEAGADPSPVDRWGGTPLDDAARSKHADVVAFLGSVGARAGKTKTGSTIDNASVELCDAAAKGDLDRLKHLVQDMRVDVDQGDYDKRTAMHLAASEGLLEVVTCLVTELKANTSPVDRWGNTPLDDAVRARHGPTAAFLRSQKAKSGKSGAKDTELSEGAKPTPRKTAADLCDAAYSGDLVRLRSYIDGGLDPNTGDYDKRTAMHLAASEGLLEVAKFLIEEVGADPSPVDRWGNTPLDDAARLNHTSVIDFLKSKGAVYGTKKGSRSCVIL